MEITFGVSTKSIPKSVSIFNMTSIPIVSPVSYASEPWGFLSPYLCPVPAKKILSPRSLTSGSPPTNDAHFEELRVIPKLSPRASTMTSLGGSPTTPYPESPAKYEGAHIPPGSWATFESRDYPPSGWTNIGTFYDEDSGFAEPRTQQQSPAITDGLLAMKYGKAYPTQHELYWKSGAGHHGYESYQTNGYNPAPQSYDDLPMMTQLPSPVTPYESGMADLPRLHPDTVRADFARISEGSSASYPPNQHSQYSPGTEYGYLLQQPVDARENVTMQHPLPNFSSSFRAATNAPDPGYQTNTVFQSTDRNLGSSLNPATANVMATQRLRSHNRSHPTETVIQVPKMNKETYQTSSEDSDDSEKAKPSQPAKRKKISCNICWKAFSQTANLKAHLRIHTGEKPFHCSVCYQQFSQRSSVKTHMRIHSGERPFSCTFCKKSFYDSSTLIKHRRIHTGEKPYKCKICSQQFSQSGNLTRHYKLHTDEDKS